MMIRRNREEKCRKRQPYVVSLIKINWLPLILIYLLEYYMALAVFLFG